MDAIILDQRGGACPYGMRSKYVWPGKRGRKIEDNIKHIDVRLIQWCTKNWDKNNKVIRGTMFQRTLKCGPELCGGKFSSLKYWFYGGFKKRYDLSCRVVSSTFQKLPLDWEDKVRSIVARVAHYQMPCQKGDVSFLPRVSDARMGNTDQVPVYVEDHINHQWGFKSHRGRRIISTAREDKNRSTVQLTCFKYGRKVIPSVEKNLY